MVTDQSGNVIANGRHDYLPYGYEIAGGTAGRTAGVWGGPDYLTAKFTSQERDAETGFDHFPARYMASLAGRFLSPDPENAGADLGNPQSWNGYSYARNNPLSYLDPSGLSTCTYGGTGGTITVDCVDSTRPDPVRGIPGWLQLIWDKLYYLGLSPSTEPALQLPQKAPPVSQPPLTISRLDTPLQDCSAALVDPILGALEFTVKFGPEVEGAVGPFKLSAGGSFYKNISTGATGASLDLSAVLVGAQIENRTPTGGSFGGGSPGPEYKISALGYQRNLSTGEKGFAPSIKLLSIQALVGAELSFNADTSKRISALNSVCRAQGRR